MRMRRLIFWLLVVVDFAALSVLAKAQALIDTADSSSSPVNLSVSTPNPLPDLTYIRPTETTKLRNYVFDAFGPYPIVGAGSRLRSARRIIPRRHGSKALRVTANDSGPTSASRR